MFKRILLYLFPVILIFYGSEKLDGRFYGHPEPDPTLEIICYLVGVAVANVIIPVKSERLIKKIDKQDELIQFLLSQVRVKLNGELESKLNVNNLNMNIRVLTPKKSFPKWVKKVFKGERVFYIRPNKSLASDDVGCIHFRVNPQPEGLVGKVFANKTMMHDFEISVQKSKNDYSLNPHQLSVLSETKFVAAMPIFEDESSDKITAIISFDTKNNINLPQNEDWQKPIVESCMIIKKCIPFICQKN